MELEERKSIVLQTGRTTMKRILISSAILATAFSSAAEAKGCIKGAIVGGVAGHMAGHGKLGAAAGCAVGHHEANKADAEKAKGQSTNPPPKDSGKCNAFSRVGDSLSATWWQN
jgi:uncharacterized protein YcfJ